MTIDQINKLKEHNVLVIGDIILDEYIDGEVTRISPEAPVPIVERQFTNYILGGAANVAANIQSLGSKATLIGIAGNDKYYDVLKKMLVEQNINTAVLKSQRKTTVKSRIMANDEQLLRLDHEDNFLISTEEQDILIDKITKEITSKKYDGVVLQDYNKGIFTPTLITTIIQLCEENNIPSYVDPKLRNIEHFYGCTVFKPNLAELNSFAKGETHEKKLAYIYRLLQPEYIICTKGEEGLSILKDGININFPTNKIEKPDVSGAGDSTLAAIVLAHLSGYGEKEMGLCANAAGNIVCNKPRISLVYFSEIGVKLL